MDFKPFVRRLGTNRTDEEPAGQVARSTVEAVSFWCAIVIPLLYVPLLSNGPETVTGTVVFVALLAVHLMSLAMGHTYRPD